MALRRKFTTDNKAETQGIWLDFGDQERIRVARAGGSNEAFLKALERVTRKYRQEISLGTLDRETDQALMREVYAETVCLGWEGINDKDGKPLPFTKANCIALLTELPELFRYIQASATQIENFQNAEAEVAEKNS